MPIDKAGKLWYSIDRNRKEMSEAKKAERKDWFPCTCQFLYTWQSPKKGILRCTRYLTPGRKRERTDPHVLGRPGKDQMP